jgi:hypothetical protein
MTSWLGLGHNQLASCRASFIKWSQVEIEAIYWDFALFFIAKVAQQLPRVAYEQRLQMNSRRAVRAKFGE